MSDLRIYVHNMLNITVCMKYKQRELPEHGFNVYFFPKGLPTRRKQATKLLELLPLRGEAIDDFIEMGNRATKMAGEQDPIAKATREQERASVEMREQETRPTMVGKPTPMKMEVQGKYNIFIYIFFFLWSRDCLLISLAVCVCVRVRVCVRACVHACVYGQSSHTHTHAHTYTHARTHARTHTHTHSLKTFLKTYHYFLPRAGQFTTA